MQERLQKILSQAGIASRRESETIITDGRVAVNGTVVTELGTKADPDTDTITVDGKPLLIIEKRAYILLYKPVGYMTTMKDPEGRPIVSDLLKGVKERVYPIGRLDYNTEGLLLLTNDGALANFLMHPSHEVDKGYLVRVSGHVSPEQMQRLAEGVQLDDGMTAPAKVLPVSESENNSWISITIHEGRYRQVRRMCEAVGLSVVRLKRSRYDFLEIGDLKPGDFRSLQPEEVARLKRQTTAVAAERGAAKENRPAKDRGPAKGSRMAKPGDAAKRVDGRRSEDSSKRAGRGEPGKKGDFATRGDSAKQGANKGEFAKKSDFARKAESPKRAERGEPAKRGEFATKGERGDSFKRGERGGAAKATSWSKQGNSEAVADVTKRPGIRKGSGLIVCSRSQNKQDKPK